MTPVRAREQVAAVAVLLGLLALYLLLRLGGGAPTPPADGLPDPGALTGWALPLLGLASIALGVAVVGCLLVPLLSMRTLADDLRQRSLRAVKAVRLLAAAWCLVCVGELAFTYSDLFAKPLWRVSPDAVVGFAFQVSQGQALLVQAGMALVLAVVSRWVLSVRESAWLLVLGVVGMLPPTLTGHSAASGSHDTAIVSLLLHVGSATVWAGGVIALWWHLGGTPQVQQRAGGRFAKVAPWCLVVTAASGLVNVLVRLASPTELVTTDYGRGASAKILVIAGLALVAIHARRAALGRVRGESLGQGLGWRALTVVTSIEIVLMAVAAGLGVALSRTPTPVGEVYTSVAENLLGGPVPPAPDLQRLVLSWTPSGAGLTVVGLGGAAYVVGLVTLRRRGDRWPVLRTVAWFVGLLLVGYATFGGLGTYSHVMFSAHMGSHMVLSMIAPILLVLGAPITLALRTLPGADVPGAQGPRQWLAGALRSWPVRLLTHPLVAAALFVGSLYAIYFTGIFDSLMENHLGHGFMELHFLLVGSLYYEVLVGDAPVPHRLSHLARLGMLLVVVPFHAFFAIAVMSSSTVIGGPYYALLHRGYATDMLHDQYIGGSITWGMGEVPMVLVLVVLVLQWYRADVAEARRHDRRSARDNDADLTAYNRMLGRLAGAGDAADDSPDRAPEPHDPR